MRNVIQSHDGSPVFLEKKLNFIAVFLVLLTTVFGWYFPNSWFIVLLLVCRLFDGDPLGNIRTAFSNKLFLAYLVYFLIGAAGYLYTHNLASQGSLVSKESTLVAIAFTFCAGQFGNRRTYRKLVTAYCLILAAASLYCLVFACYNYFRIERSSAQFFYHTLTIPLSQNAAFYSVYMLIGIIFLLSPIGEPVIGSSKRRRVVMRYTLLIFFLAVMVLLSSRLLLVVTPLVVLHIIWSRYSYRKRKIALIIAGSLVLIAVAVLAAFNNPIRWRFGEINEAQLAYGGRDKFDSVARIGSLGSRLVQWRFAGEILHARHAWLFGVSPGDSQRLLDQKYIDGHFYLGDLNAGPNRHDRGILGFNFHDQYIETLVKSGLAGLAALAGIFALLFREARLSGSREAWYIVLILVIFFIPEAPLTMQQGVFLFCFFPLMAVGMREERIPSDGQINKKL
jgi:O-antigen ligase